MGTVYDYIILCLQKLPQNANISRGEDAKGKKWNKK